MSEKRNDGCNCYINCEQLATGDADFFFGEGAPANPSSLGFTSTNLAGVCGQDDCNYQIIDDDGCVSYFLKKRVKKNNITNVYQKIFVEKETAEGGTYDECEEQIYSCSGGFTTFKSIADKGNGTTTGGSEWSFQYSEEKTQRFSNVKKNDYECAVDRTSMSLSCTGSATISGNSFAPCAGSCSWSKTIQFIEAPIFGENCTWGETDFQYTEDCCKCFSTEILCSEAFPSPITSNTPDTAIRISQRIPPEDNKTVTTYESVISFFECKPELSEDYTYSRTAYKFSNDYGTTENIVTLKLFIAIPPTTCYIKVWLKRKITTYISSGLCGDEWTEDSVVYEHIKERDIIEITPEMMASNNGYCLNNLLDIYSEENSPTNYIALPEIPVVAPQLNSSVDVAIWKFSFFPKYKPDDGSDEWPFEPLTEPIINGNGFPSIMRPDPPVIEY